MKAFTKLVLIAMWLGAAGPAGAQPAKPAASAAETIKQLEQRWADAMIAVDVPALSQIVADDWISGHPGKTATKASFLDSVKSGKHKLEACEFGPRDVQVLGDVAVLQGSVTETRLVDGKRATVRVTYMDVWVKRGDRWVVFRSHASKL